MDDFSMERASCMNDVLRSTIPNPLKDSVSVKEDKECTDVYTDAAAAFLGPQIWEKPLTDFKLDYLLDLDQILGNSSSDNRNQRLECGTQNVNEGVSQFHQLTVPHNSNLGMHAMPSPRSVSSHSPSLRSSPASSVQDISCDGMKKAFYSVDCKFSPTDLALATPPGQDHYDPTSTTFADEELKPQPIIKKSRKNFVPDNLKDDKYWARRHKNNMAAKRSREARRLKENQIVLRASYLEKENSSLKEDVMRLKAENDMLKNQLKEYQS